MASEIIQLELRKFVSPEYIFGVDARLMVANYCKQLGGKTVLLVSDAGVANTPWLIEIESILKNQSVEYHSFLRVSPNPRDFEVMEGVEVYLKNNCNIIVAIGGGSVMDCAKGIGIVSTNGGSIEMYEGVDKIRTPMPPLICIPTTAGTAADMSQFAIINRYNERYKMAIISKATVPDVALVDPFVLTTMDSFLTACTGMDALSHAFEAYVSNASSAFTDLYAIEAVKLITQNLCNSIANPNDLQLRGKIMLGSLYAGLAFSNASLGCVHSMAHSLGGYLDLPHGECNAILLPHVVNYNYNSSPYKYDYLANIMGCNLLGNYNADIRNELVNYLINFKNSVNIKATLGSNGVKSDIISTLATKAISDPCNATNPKPPCKHDLECIYKEAI